MCQNRLETKDFFSSLTFGEKRSARLREIYKVHEPGTSTSHVKLHFC